MYGGQIDAGQVAAAALYHDASEIITGDMPTPIKYYAPRSATPTRRSRRSPADGSLAMLPDELRPDYDDVLDCADGEVLELVKAADKPIRHIKCVEELQAGNAEFRRAAEQTRARARRDGPARAGLLYGALRGELSMTLDELE